MATEPDNGKDEKKTMIKPPLMPLETVALRDFFWLRENTMLTIIRNIECFDSVEAGDCWLWKGNMNIAMRHANIYPDDPNITCNARRLFFSLIHRWYVAPWMYFDLLCPCGSTIQGDKCQFDKEDPLGIRCINPKHPHGTCRYEHKRVFANDCEFSTGDMLESICVSKSHVKTCVADLKTTKQMMDSMKTIGSHQRLKMVIKSRLDQGCVFDVENGEESECINKKHEKSCDYDNLRPKMRLCTFSIDDVHQSHCLTFKHRPCTRRNDRKLFAQCCFALYDILKNSCGRPNCVNPGHTLGDMPPANLLDIIARRLLDNKKYDAKLRLSDFLHGFRFRDDDEYDDCPDLESCELGTKEYAMRSQVHIAANNAAYNKNEEVVKKKEKLKQRAKERKKSKKDRAVQERINLLKEVNGEKPKKPRTQKTAKREHKNPHNASIADVKAAIIKAKLPPKPRGVRGDGAESKKAPTRVRQSLKRLLALVLFQGFVCPVRNRPLTDTEALQVIGHKHKRLLASFDVFEHLTHKPPTSRRLAHYVPFLKTFYGEERVGPSALAWKVAFLTLFPGVREQTTELFLLECSSLDELEYARALTPKNLMWSFTPMIQRLMEGATSILQMPTAEEAATRERELFPTAIQSIELIENPPVDPDIESMILVE